MEQPVPLRTLQVGFHKKWSRLLHPDEHRGGKNPLGVRAVAVVPGARGFPVRADSLVQAGGTWWCLLPSTG